MCMCICIRTRQVKTRNVQVDLGWLLCHYEHIYLAIACTYVEESHSSGTTIRSMTEPSTLMTARTRAI